MKNFLKTMLTVKKNNKTTTDKILDIKTNIIKNEKLIIQIENELKFYINLNEKIQADLYMTTIRKNTSEISEKQAKAYCNEIKKKFRVVVETIEHFEGILNKLNEEKEFLINEYNNKLEILAEDKVNLFNEQDELKIKIDFQEDCIRELEEKYEKAKEEKRIQFEFFERKNEEDVDKYNDLNSKYYELNEKLKQYMHEEVNEEIQQNLTKRTYNIMDREKEEAKL